MAKLNLTVDQAKALYPNSSPEWKDILHSNFGKKTFIKNIMDAVKSFEDACEIEGVNPADVLKYCEDEAEIAEKKLKLIIKVLNEGFVFDLYNINQGKYYPYFDCSGGGFAFDDYLCNCTCTHVGGRLVFKTRELATYAGKQFTDLYRIYITGK